MVPDLGYGAEKDRRMSLRRPAVPPSSRQFVLLRQRVRLMQITSPILNAEEWAKRVRVFEAVQKRIAQAKSGKRYHIGRNELCWCGSMKKFKKCHYPNQ